MKKTAVVLCILLSLFVFVSCPEPDNAPKNNKLVIKVRNSDLPAGSEKINVNAFGAEGELFNPSLVIDVTKGEFTEIPLTDKFIAAFKTGNRIQFSVVGMKPDADMKDDVVTIYFNYSNDQDTYIIERNNGGKPAVTESREYEIIIAPQGKLIADIAYVTCSINIDDSSELTYLESGSDGKFHQKISMAPGGNVTLYVQAYESGKMPIADIASVNIKVPENSSNPIAISPSLVSYGKIMIRKPAKSPLPENRLHFSVQQLDAEGQVIKVDVDGAVPTWSESETFYIKSGMHRFSSRQYISAVQDPKKEAVVAFELASNESVIIVSNFSDTEQSTAEVLREE